MSTDRLILSASSVTTFLRCGQQWFWAYVRGVKSPPSLRMARGTAVHAAVEYNMVQKILTKEDVHADEMLDVFSSAFEDEIADGFTPDDELTPGGAKDSGYALTKLHRIEVSPTIQPVWVEKPVQFNLNDVTFSGQIDLADEMGRIRDTKTTGRKPRPESYLLNMTGYALAARQLTGEIETDTVLDYLVATQKPYYLPISAGGPVSDDEIDRFANIVENVAENIEAGKFPANGVQNGACTWCGYRSMCSYALPG